jgi:hypothetical protein
MTAGVARSLLEHCEWCTPRSNVPTGLGGREDIAQDYPAATLEATI